MGEWTDLNTGFFELKDFSWYVIKPDGTAGSGLKSGDDVVIGITYWMYAHNIMLLWPYKVKVSGRLNGQVSTWTSGLGSGRESCRQNVKFEFTGKMPAGESLSGKLTFEGYQASPFGLIVGQGIPFAEAPIGIPNMDDIPPDGDGDGIPPAVCTEGDTRCLGYDLYVCKNSQWVVKEYNSAECGYTPEPICTDGQERCKGTDLQVCIGGEWKLKERNSSRCGYVPPDGDKPVPPDGDGGGIPGWFDRNKRLIIIVSAAVLVISIIVLVTKARVQSPVAAWPKFQPPIVRK